MKRLLLAVGSLALVAMLGLSLIDSGVGAQDTATPEAGDSTTESQPTETKESTRDAYLAALAANLGVTTEELQAAIDATNSELGVEGGLMGGGKSGGSRDDHDGPSGGPRGMGGFGMGGPGGGSVLRGIDLADAAVFLAITEDDLKTEMDGSSFLEIALAHGKTTEEVRAFLIEQATADIDERLQEASSAPAGAETSEDSADESTSISEATEVPADPALTPTATA